jgi:hypothetical protein
MARTLQEDYQYEKKIDADLPSDECPQNDAVSLVDAEDPQDEDHKRYSACNATGYPECLSDIVI